MYVVTRTYRNTSDWLAKVVSENSEELGATMRGVPGFVSYIAARAGNDVISITVCNAKAGADESMRRAREWLATKNPPNVNPPEAAEGEVLVHIK